MEGLEKVRMNIYIKKKEKEKFLGAIVRLANGNDGFYNNCFIVTKDMKVIDSEQKKIADRVDRWIEIKNTIIPETSSFNIWRRVKILEECKEDFENDSNKIKAYNNKNKLSIQEIENDSKELKESDNKNRLLIQEIENDNITTTNPFDSK
tara:strand:+ start:558 stop:1007 length:450 start_codon:yes stop_codon:yes gene_type:complete